MRVGAVVVQPWASEVWTLIRLPFTRDGVLTALALSLPLLVASLPLLNAVSGVLEIVFLSALSGYYFLVVDHIGRGRDALPGPSDSFDDIGGMMLMMLRGVGCLVLGGVPLVIWRIYLGTSVSPTLSSHPVTILALEAIGHTYVPAIILALVITEQESALFWPPLWIQIVLRAPLAYLELVGWFLLSLLVWWLVSVAARHSIGRAPIVGTWLAESVSTLFLLVQATVVGGYLRRHSSQFELK